METRLILFVVALLALQGLLAASARAGATMMIDGVDELKWGQGHDTTYIAALHALARFEKIPVTYDFLMGGSGAAFKVHRWQKGWCPSAGVLGPGYPACEKATDLLGWKMKFLPLMWEEDDSTRDANRRHLRDVLRTGQPVLFELMDDGLVVGYTGDPIRFIVRSFADKDGQPTTLAEDPWYALPVESKGELMSHRSAVKRSLEIALELAETESFGDYYSGWKAYDDWVSSLREYKPEAEESGTIHANAFCYSMLLDARSSAGRYLRSVAGDLGPQSKPHLLRAASLYGDVYKTLALKKPNVPFGWDLKDGATWTQQMRDEQAAALEKAKKLEQDAVDEIRLALASAE